MNLKSSCKVMCLFTFLCLDSLKRRPTLRFRGWRFLRLSLIIRKGQRWAWLFTPHRPPHTSVPLWSHCWHQVLQSQPLSHWMNPGSGQLCSVYTLSLVCLLLSFISCIVNLAHTLLTDCLRVKKSVKSLFRSHIFSLSISGSYLTERVLFGKGYVVTFNHVSKSHVKVIADLFQIQHWTIIFLPLAHLA